jgi:hypothetical protein
MPSRGLGLSADRAARLICAALIGIAARRLPNPPLTKLQRLANLASYSVLGFRQRVTLSEGATDAGEAFKEATEDIEPALPLQSRQAR